MKNCEEEKNEIFWACADGNTPEEEDRKMTKEEMDQAKALQVTTDMDSSEDGDGDDWLAVKRTTSNDSPRTSPTIAARRKDDNYYIGLSEGLEKHGGESKEEVPDPYDPDIAAANAVAARVEANRQADEQRKANNIARSAAIIRAAAAAAAATAIAIATAKATAAASDDARAHTTGNLDETVNNNITTKVQQQNRTTPQITIIPKKKPTPD